MTKHKTILFYILAALTIATTIFPQSPKRSDVPDKYKWNLADIYPTLADWQNDIKKVEGSINDFASYKGKLGENSQNLLNALNSYFGLLKTFYKAGTYAGNLSNEDVRISENQALLQIAFCGGHKVWRNSILSLSRRFLQSRKKRLKNSLKKNRSLILTRCI